MSERAIEGKVRVPASISDVWEAWTTEDGIRSFFAPDCRIDVAPDGIYEIYFNPKAPMGERGGEGVRILAVQEPRMLSFTWNAPPALPEVRRQHTHVTVRLEEAGAESTRVTLRHDGWGVGGQWDQAFAYFESAWKQIVLPRLKYRFVHGPVDWSNPPGAQDLQEETESTD